MSAIVRIAIGALLIVAASRPGVERLFDPRPGLHYALHALWILGGIAIGDGLMRGTSQLRLRRAERTVQE